MLETALSAAAGGGSFAGVLLFARWVIVWLTGRHDRRQALLDEQDLKQDLAWKAIREELKEQIAGLSKQVETIGRQNNALRIAFHHVAGALIHVDPTNPALIQAEKILSQAFPLDLSMLAEQAGRALDRAVSAAEHE